MKVFVDANILVSVLNKEYPLFTHTARILSLADSREFTLFTSPICLAIAFYFAEKKYKSAAKQKISLLCDHLKIAEANAAAIKKCLENPAIKDFEDGIEYYAAVESGCHCIVTEDTKDFYFSKIEVLNSHDFFLKHMAKK
ncbi:MAG: PIN domain-containing protein [Chitinophagaceae bacterium]